MHAEVEHTTRYSQLLGWYLEEVYPTQMHAKVEHRLLKLEMCINSHDMLSLKGEQRRNYNKQ